MHFLFNSSTFPFDANISSLGEPQNKKRVIYLGITKLFFDPPLPHPIPPPHSAIQALVVLYQGQLYPYPLGHHLFELEVLKPPMLSAYTSFPPFTSND